MKLDTAYSLDNMVSLNGKDFKKEFMDSVHPGQLNLCFSCATML